MLFRKLLWKPNLILVMFFLRGFAYPTEWEVINIKLINDIVHYELKDVRSPKSVVLSEWALNKDDSWKFHKNANKKEEES